MSSRGVRFNKGRELLRAVWGALKQLSDVPLQERQSAL